MRGIVIALLIIAISAISFAEIGPGRYQGPVKYPLFPQTDDTDEDSLFYHEDFESGMNGWTTVDLTIQENEWNPDPFNAFEGNSWWCGDSNAAGAGYMGYDNFWLQYMDTPVLDLSGTANPMLTFQVYWSVETPFAVPPAPPYDGWDGCTVWISDDGGASFTPITPVTPAYTCNSLSSLGTVWRMGPYLPGWADQSVTWRAAEFNLSAYTGNNVKIRFSLCSDRAVASSTGHPELTGFFVDDVEVADGANVIYFNNADDPPVGGDFTFEQGPPFGDYWEMVETTSYSPTHCLRVDDDNFYINNALVSPEIEIPEDYTTWFRYAVYCNLPDSTHPGSESLRDYYLVDITADGGTTWEQQFYDYARGYCFLDWGICEPGIPWVGNTSMDLSGYAGQSIQIRFRCVTDGDHTSGNGEGLHIDDLWIEGSDMLANDCGAANLYLPFPNTVGYSLDCSVELHNYGLNDQTSVVSFFVAGSDVVPLAPWENILSNQYVDKDFIWTPSTVESSNPYAYTVILGDMNPANDTTFAGEVNVMEPYYYELGYDNRIPVYAYEFQTGNGPLVKFTRPENAFFGLYLDSLKVMFNGDLPAATQFTYHVYDEGTPTTPGDFVFSETVSVDPEQTYPYWFAIGHNYIPLTEELQGDFWIWAEVTDPSGFPHFIGHDPVWGSGHYFDYDGSTASQYDADLLLRFMGPEFNVEVEEIKDIVLSEFTIEAVCPNPFNNSTKIAYSLPQAGNVRLAVYDVTGRQVAVLTDAYFQPGSHSVDWNAGDSASGVYFIELMQNDLKAVKKVVLMK